MILIDAVKLKKSLPKYADYWEALAWIDEAEEVDAIPIEWIKKWCNIEHKSCEERLMLRYGVITMIEDWEKENETNRQR